MHDEQFQPPQHHQAYGTRRAAETPVPDSSLSGRHSGQLGYICPELYICYH
jgi:hypothetical protein